MSTTYYESHKTGNDFISITVYDGINGNCLTSSENRPINYASPISALQASQALKKTNRLVRTQLTATTTINAVQQKL